MPPPIMPAPMTPTWPTLVALGAKALTVRLRYWSARKIPTRFAATGVCAIFAKPLASMANALSRVIPACFCIVLMAVSGLG